jgi:hypothetical protein
MWHTNRDWTYCDCTQRLLMPGYVLQPIICELWCFETYCLFESVLALLEACCFGERKLACVCDVLRCRYYPYAFDMCACKITRNVRLP